MLVSFSLHQVQRSNGRPQCFCHSGIRLSVCYFLNSHCLNTLTHLCEKTLILLRALHAPVISWAPSRTHQKGIITFGTCMHNCLSSSLAQVPKNGLLDTSGSRGQMAGLAVRCPCSKSSLTTSLAASSALSRGACKLVVWGGPWAAYCLNAVRSLT